MKEKVLRKLFLGFVQIHILHHAKKKGVSGTWLMEELKGHGYTISPGTLYPLLHRMADQGLLKKEDVLVKGKVSKLYVISEFGEEILVEAVAKAGELFHEVVD